MLKRKSISILTLFILGVLMLLDYYIGISEWPFVLLLCAFLVITICGSFFIQWNYHLTSLHGNKNTSKNQIAITFDDGPHPEFTPKALELLKKHKAKATFFCIGKHVEKYPEIVKRILAEGHLVGNHTYSHSNFFGFFGTEKVIADLRKTIKSLQLLIHKKPILYRPAFGVTNPMIAKAVKQMKISSIGWNVRSLDTTARSEKQILNRVTKKLSKGDIVLLHDTSQKTIDVLEQLLLFLEEKNLESVTVDLLLEIEAYA